MIPDLRCNNKIMTQEERIKFNILADELIATYSTSIDGMYEIGKDYKNMSNLHHKVSKIMSDASVFVAYAFADCVALTKLFINTDDSYVKSLLRGKLKVHLNESFKKLYGFDEKTYKKSYCARLDEIMPHFHGPDIEYKSILADLEEMSKYDSWWKDIRCAEVHIDIPLLYESRHEIVNESQVVMETRRLIPFFCRFNDLLSRMGQAHLDYMFAQLDEKDRAALFATNTLIY